MSKKSEVQSLENYLAQIERELRALPSQARADEMREIEAHLRTMIEARGDVAGVLAQFGKPRKVGRDLRRAWERKQPEAWWRAILALIAGVAVQAFATILLVAVVQISSEYSWDTKFQVAFSPSIAVFIGVSLMILYYSAVPFASGLAMGAVSPKRSKWIIGLYFVSLLAIVLFEQIRIGNSDSDFGGDLLSSLLFGLGAHVATSLLGFYGVHLGARRERHHQRFARFVGLK